MVKGDVLPIDEKDEEETKKKVEEEPSLKKPTMQDVLLGHEERLRLLEFKTGLRSY